jgi:hypothetical protein
MMIIITATLSFETEADRDNAVALTASVQFRFDAVAGAGA